MAIIIQPINADGLRRELAERFPDGEPEFEKWPEWHDWSCLIAALRLAEKPR